MSTNLKKKICIIDLNLGNLNSIYNAVQSLGYCPIISNEKNYIINSSKIILPGNGNFNFAMQQLKILNLEELIKNEVLKKGKIILGICLGMQIMFELGYEENKTEGLGFFRGKVEIIKNLKNLKTFSLPHIGWNEVDIINSKSLIYKGIKNNSSFYYLNSYVCNSENLTNITGYTEYSQKFISSVESENIFGVQFHPEKSQNCGIILIKNWLEL